MIGRQIKAKISRNERVVGTCLWGVGNPFLLKYYLNIDMDLVFIDNEHNPLDKTTTSHALTYFANAGIAPLLRIENPDAYLASKGLDAGAHGIMVPYVETADEAWKVVSAVRYKPLKGKALEYIRKEGVFPSKETKTYVNKRNEDGFVVVMLESRAGLDKLDEILAVKGITAIVIGPNDFSTSLGVPDQYDHPIFIEAAEEALRKSKEKGVGFGLHLSDMEKQKFWVDKGANFIIYASEAEIAQRYLLKELRSLRK